MEEIKVSVLIAAIKQAFEQMSAERGWYQDLGLTKTGAGAIMNRFKKGNLSIEKMAELLEAKNIDIDLAKYQKKGIREVAYLVPIEDIEHVGVNPKQLYMVEGSDGLGEPRIFEHSVMGSVNINLNDHEQTS